MKMQMNNVPEKYIIIYSDRHESYDLFRDLKNRADVQLIVTRPKKISGKLLKKIRKIHLSGTIANHLRLPFKSAWYEKLNIETDENVQYYLMVVDMALSSIPLPYFKKIAAKPNVKTILIMINSMRSNTMRQVRKEFHETAWDAVLTFDD